MAKEYLDKLSTFIEKVLTSRPQNTSFECKHFFSGAALYVDNRICITLTPVGLAIKLPEKMRENLFQNKLATPLRYFPNGPFKKEYALFSTGINGSEDRLIGYVKEGINYVLSLPAAKTDLKIVT